MRRGSVGETGDMDVGAFGQIPHRDSVTRSDLAASYHFSTGCLSRLIERYALKSFRELQSYYRQEGAKALLRCTDLSVDAISELRGTPRVPTSSGASVSSPHCRPPGIDSAKRISNSILDRESLPAQIITKFFDINVK